MSASELAAVVADLVDPGHAHLEFSTDGLESGGLDLRRMSGLTASMAKAIVIDATAIYEGLEDHSAADDALDDLDLSPPWSNAIIGYTPDARRVFVVHAEVHSDRTSAGGAMWMLSTWMGGRNARGEAMRTYGPIDMTNIVVGESKTEVLDRFDLYTELPEGVVAINRSAVRTAMATINFVNCRNVELVEPTRTRAERRRIERTGVRVHELTIRPIGRSSTGSGEVADGAVPFTSVRGHFAQYGPKYGRGLLFGQHEGRYWIPQHARGSAEHGTVEQRFTIETE